MWFKYGLKAQKLLAQGVWGLLAKLNLRAHFKKGHILNPV